MPTGVPIRRVAHDPSRVLSRIIHAQLAPLQGVVPAGLPQLDHVRRRVFEFAAALAPIDRIISWIAGIGHGVGREISRAHADALGRLDRERRQCDRGRKASARKRGTRDEPKGQHDTTARAANSEISNWRRWTQGFVAVTIEEVKGGLGSVSIVIPTKPAACSQLETSMKL